MCLKSVKGLLFIKGTPFHGNPHYIPKTVWRPSGVNNGNPYTYTYRTVLSYWMKALTILYIIPSSTHPSSDWEQQLIPPSCSSQICRQYLLSSFSSSLDPQPPMVSPYMVIPLQNVCYKVHFWITLFCWLHPICITSSRRHRVMSGYVC